MLTPYCPEVVRNAKYSLKETAAKLGLHPNTVRNYTHKGLIRVEYSKANGWPRYTGSEILRFWNETL